MYRGPVLFGTDVSMAGGFDIQNLPALDKEELEQAVPVLNEDRMFIALKNGITLGDFYHLGVTGGHYVSWLKVNE